MNNSGDAVQFLQTKYKDDLLIVNDEYNFDFGRVQVKQCRSDGGHNGVASVIEVMDGALFYQMRFGIAKNFGLGEMIEYVLSDFSNEEQDKLPDLLNYSVKAIEFFICNRDNKSKAISYINSGQIDSEMQEDA
jgi:PTH1 family peptidyl-tRNA hydrolase